MDIDSIIDKLSWHDGEWLGTVELPLLGGEIELIVGSNTGDKPDLVQTNQLNWFIENLMVLHPQIESKLFEYYLAAMPHYHKGLGEYAEKLMPYIRSEKEVWKFVSEPGLYVFSSDECSELHLEFECTFDVEHGVRVVFENNKLNRVGID